MKYLIDTNVISELARKTPNISVVKWIETVEEQQLYVSSLTLGEIRKGIDNISANKKKQHQLNVWFDALKQRFNDRILPIDNEVSEYWGTLCASIKTPSAIDSLIAATASFHHCTLVSRNIKDFKAFNLEMINPWEQ